MARKNWYPLDNAAKIYPPNTNYKSPFVFSFTARIDSEVQPEILKKAVTELLQKMPTFKTKLKRGIFWYYLEENKKSVPVTVQPPHYLRQIVPENSNEYMFETFYRKNTITVNFHHSLTDGTGGLNFFLELLFEYFILRGDDVESEGILRPSAAPHVFDEAEDTFRLYDKKKDNFSMFEKDAYRFSGTPYNYDGFGIICGVCPIEQIKNIAKSYDTTITVYLAALYMYSIFECRLKDKPVRNKEVKILVPINLRTRFASKTMRNFALFSRLKHNFEKEITFEECINLCKEQMKDGMDNEVIEKMIHSNVKYEKNIFMKVVPLFLKDLVMKLTYSRVGENLQSGDLSNLGLVKTPECFNGRLKDLTFLIGPTAGAMQNFGVLGYNGNMYITSARGYVENDLERTFFQKLAQSGADITVFSNYWEADL